MEAVCSDSYFPEYQTLEETESQQGFHHSYDLFSTGWVVPEDWRSCYVVKHLPWVCETLGLVSCTKQNCHVMSEVGNTTHKYKGYSGFHLRKWLNNLKGFWFLLVLFVCFWTHPAVFKHNSWWCSGDHIWDLKSNLGLLSARKMPSPLYYSSGPWSAYFARWSHTSNPCNYQYTVQHSLYAEYYYVWPTVNKNLLAWYCLRHDQPWLVLSPWYALVFKLCILGWGYK